MTPGEVITAMKQSLSSLDCPVYTDGDSNFQPPCVLIGNPTLSYENYAENPTSGTVSVYVVEKATTPGAAAVLYNDRVPAAVRALWSGVDGCVVTQSEPGSLTAGTQELPCYTLTAEVSF